MGPDRIRALRGARTRAELARQLGVTPLTVLRWELPEDNKEARRPRRAMVEALERLSHTAPAVASVRRDSPSTVDEIDPEDRALLSPLLATLESAAWQRGEDELLTLLAANGLRSAAGRALATVELCLRQILARLDVRGALTTLLPLLAEVEAGTLPRGVALRVHTTAAVLFGAPDPRLYDPGRVHAHQEAALALLEAEDDDQRVFLALAGLSAKKLLGMEVLQRAFADVLELEAKSPFARCLLDLMKSLGALILGDRRASSQHGEAAMSRAEELGLAAVVVGALADRAEFALQTGLPNDDILVITQRARKSLERARLGPIDPVMRVVAAECSALTRLARFSDALATCEEAHALAARAGVPPFAIVAAEARLRGLTNDQAGLQKLLSALTPEVVPSLRPLARGHQRFVEAVLASMRGDYSGAASLADQAVLEIDGFGGMDFTAHDFVFEGLLARTMAGDVAGGFSQIERARRLDATMPSPFYRTMTARFEGLLLLASGRAREALAQIEGTMGYFEQCHDVVQLVLGKNAIALTRQALGEPDAAKQIEEAVSEAAKLGIVPRPLTRAAGGDGGAAAFAERLMPLASVHQRAQSARNGAALRPITLEATVTPELPDLVAASPAMQALRRSVMQLAGSRATVLIQGESGSGKEVVARAIHDVSARAKRAYVPFNCASVPRDLFEGLLFGHKRGAFTGADQDQLGVLRAADKGSVFLDEIGELPLDAQPKLLRFLENGEVFPLGERQAIRVDVRVIAATHRDLAQLVREGRFREDLFYRLNVVPLRVPPLRDRPEDVVALAERFLARFSADGDRAARLSDDAIDALIGHGWPGNVRELRNLIERTLAFGAPAGEIAREQLRFD